ncbi:hypothetical protein HMPREF2531_00196 [Bacteroides intestinalis]|uniref:Uncharacterized protein n=2 Tax=Bacteroides TaxID=816 RepID=A0A139LV31_9BACE|nr:hypothetical protein BACCELL_05375 [Bacteroides cellulosilyticus DSM 14838]KXT55309.1 hypothetical protein HMPREF2531_00196 [Bacteroides intestinalis]
MGQNCKTERTERRNLEIPSVIGCISPYICPHTWNKKSGQLPIFICFSISFTENFYNFACIKERKYKK